MTRESLKEYYKQIENAPSPSNRWLPEIVCEQVDLIFDHFEAELQAKDELIQKMKCCQNCKKFLPRSSQQCIVINCRDYSKWECRE